MVNREHDTAPDTVPVATRDLLRRLGDAKRRRADAAAPAEREAAAREVDDLLTELRGRADRHLTRFVAKAARRRR